MANMKNSNSQIHTNGNKKKKQSLKDFLSDDSYGGHMNWADDDYDPTSLGVPTFTNNTHYHDNMSYQSNSYSEFGQSRFSQNRFNDMNGPNSPPYIVKMTNIPSFFGIEDIEGLFHSRFMKYLKVKVFWEINFEIMNTSSDPLDALNYHKKTAFVELNSPQDMNKVLNWRDLYLDNGLGRVMTMVGNFQDFRTYNDLHQRVSEQEDPSFAQIEDNRRRGPMNPPQHSMDHQFQRQQFPQNNHQPFYQNGVTQPPREDFPAFQQPPLQQRRKSNPFGDAKPVDTLSRQLELESKLKELEINKTTYRTLGHDSKFFPIPKHHQELFQDEPNKNSNESLTTVENEKKKITTTTPKPKLVTLSSEQFKPAPPPQTSAWGSANTTTNIILSTEESKFASSKSGGTINRPSSGTGVNSRKSEKKIDSDGKTKIILKKKVVNERKRLSPSVEPEVRALDSVVKETSKSTEELVSVEILPSLVPIVQEPAPFKVQPQHMAPSPIPKSTPVFQQGSSSIPSPIRSRQGRGTLKPESTNKYRSTSPVKSSNEKPIHEIGSNNGTPINVEEQNGINDLKSIKTTDEASKPVLDKSKDKKLKFKKDKVPKEKKEPISSKIIEDAKQQETSKTNKKNQNQKIKKGSNKHEIIEYDNNIPKPELKSESTATTTETTESNVSEIPPRSPSKRNRKRRSPPSTSDQSDKPSQPQFQTKSKLSQEEESSKESELQGQSSSTRGRRGGYRGNSSSRGRGSSRGGRGRGGYGNVSKVFTKTDDK